jgi:hypothetical protein
MSVFKPEPRTNVKTVRHINYTCGPERYAALEAIAKSAGVGLKELLRQMVDFRDRDGARSAETACPAPAPKDRQARAGTASPNIAQPRVKP